MESIAVRVLVSIDHIFTKHAVKYSDKLVNVVNLSAISVFHCYEDFEDGRRVPELLFGNPH